MDCVLYKADGTQAPYEPADGKHFTLEELQHAVGGYIEMVNLGDGRMLVVNEEGKVNHLPLNEKGTRLTRGILSWRDLVVGDVLVCPEDALQGEDEDEHES